MRELYRGWPDQLIKALENWNKVELDVDPRTIVICGMGGSGIVGDYARAIAYSKGFDKPIIVVKDYTLPSFVNENDLVIVISYSGSTIETIKCFEEAIKRKCRTYIIASNGILEERASETSTPFLKVSKGLVPRVALPEMLVTLIGILNKVKEIMSKDEAFKCSVFIKENMKAIENRAKYIAEQLYAKIPIILTYEKYAPLAWRIKNELNENAKIPSKVEILPEWGHHDIVGWENPISPGIWHGLLVKDPEDINTSKLIDFANYLLSEKGVRSTSMELRGDNFFEKIIYGSLLAGFTSISLADLYGVDPLVTQSIAKYKGVIKSILS